MADCKEIDDALNRLGKQIDGYNKALADTNRRLDSLAREQSRCCKSNQKNQDLSDIYKRLAKLEKIQNAIYKYLTQGIKPVIDTIKNFIL